MPFTAVWCIYCDTGFIFHIKEDVWLPNLIKTRRREVYDLELSDRSEIWRAPVKIQSDTIIIVMKLQKVEWPN